MHPTTAPITARRPIRTLPPTLASQIAAGEVIERPASVVKELAENALDAGASQVVIEIEVGGTELVRVTDDGCGIPAHELALALTPHATSKIAAFEDLDRIATLGFRGEALASIGSVARVSIRSRTAEDDGASVIEADVGPAGPPRPAPGAVGTCVQVRNLFHATPARRKFLKSEQTERARCLAVVRDLAMANPAVGFRLIADGRTVLDLDPGQPPRERILDVLGRELEPQLLEAHADEFDDARGVTLFGLVGTPQIARPTPSAQHLFISGRPVRDRTIQHALKEAYRGLMEHTRHPTAVLLLEMSPDAVDVNVHPAKAEVRFRDSSHVHSVVLRAVREALGRADLTPALASSLAPPWTSGPRPVQPPLGDGGPRAPTAGFVDFFQRTLPAATGGRLSYEALRQAVERPVAPVPHAMPDHAESPGAMPVQTAPSAAMLQVHNSYLVTQDEQGVVIIDQHALHERVMFEYLMERLGRGPLESQRLLSPLPLPATPAQITALETVAALLAEIGIEAAALGPTSVGVFAFPSFLFDRGVEAAPFLTDLLERASSREIPPTREEALRAVVDMIACKAAVKAGDKLGHEELVSLVRLRDEVERSSSCPHGRPTSIRLTLAQLEKLFHRS